MHSAWSVYYFSLSSLLQARQSIARRSLQFLPLVLCSIFALNSVQAGANSLNGSDPPSLRSVAFEHYLTGDSETALDYYQKAVDRAIHDYGKDSSYVGELYYEMGTLSLEAKKFMKAESYLQKAVQQNPNSVMARVKFAELLEIRGKHQESLKQIQTAISKHSYSPEAREALVLWLQQNGDRTHAIHESYALSVAVKGIVTPPPMLTPPAVPPTATATLAKAPAKPNVIAAVPIHLPDKNPLSFRLPWMKEKPKEEVKKTPEPKKPVKKEPKIQTKSIKEKPVKEKKHAKAKEQPKPKSNAVEPPVELHASAAALRTTAKKLPVKKEAKKADESAPESDPAESRPDESTPKEDVKPKATAKAAEPPPKAQAPVQSPPRMTFESPKKVGKPSNHMVPPPPPMVPSYAMPPMSPMYPAAMYQKPRATKPPVKEKPKEVVKESAPEPRPSQSTSGSEEPDFILQWAGAKDKKKGK